MSHHILPNTKSAGPKMSWSLFIRYFLVNVFNGLKAQGLLAVAVLEEKKKCLFQSILFLCFGIARIIWWWNDCHLARLNTKS